MKSAIAWLCVLAGSCAGYQQASPEQVEQEERRLLRPFTSGIEVGCNELVVELTANFNDNVSRPAVDPRLHRVQRSEGEGYKEVQWINLAGDLAGAFTVTVGEPDRFEEGGYVRGNETRFTVLRGVRIRIWEGRRPMTLEAMAEGDVVVLDGGNPRDLEEYRVVDGVLRTR